MADFWVRTLLARWRDHRAARNLRVLTDYNEGRHDALANLPAQRGRGWDYRQGYIAGKKEPIDG